MISPHLPETHQQTLYPLLASLQIDLLKNYISVLDISYGGHIETYVNVTESPCQTCGPAQSGVWVVGIVQDNPTLAYLSGNYT